MIDVHISCAICQKEYVIKVREEDYGTYCSNDRPHIQEIFPYLKPEEREMFISQVCPKCWDKLFNEPEED